MIKILPLLIASLWGGGPDQYDIVIYGGTPAGIMAAIEGKKLGKSVVLIVPERQLGGMTTSGLGRTDVGNKWPVGGLAREFYRRIARHYKNPDAWRSETLEKYRKRAGWLVDADAQWSFEPHIALATFRKMLEENGVPVVSGERLDLKNGVRKEGSRITEIVMESGRAFPGKMFIDAAYEGDLMAKAGVSYIVGREPNSQYKETHNGVQTAYSKSHERIPRVDPYIVPGDPASGLLPHVAPGPPGQDGSGDRLVQAYNFRLCTTDVPENRVPWPKPENYDERQYELLFRSFEAGSRDTPFPQGRMPNRKTDINANGLLSTDHIGANYEYPEGDYALREKIYRDHVEYTQGLMWTLANHPRVPAEIRRNFQTWSLAKDEFADNAHWPPQLYVREARRMVSDYVITEHDCRGKAVARDSVGMETYKGMDSHCVQRYVDAEGHVALEGGIWEAVRPFPISYRAIVPKRQQCTNLLVPACLSASHIAYGAVRMETVFMILGQSSAVAAALAIDDACDVQAVDYPKLRKRLLAEGQILERPEK